ncbi:hypothetical protein LR48_Vigan09g202500 [Vigna angularis]|uniref:Uncharacterized protein n=1 Tax=Phaseolus angularis TaxID=3914 RepID=A0A0L9VE75_PHAAN|nr:hypothetical protein LR48_Vigan09g202500 [Vigna angularis]
MDLETENRLVVILTKEAAELRRQSETKGVLSYLRKPDPHDVAGEKGKVLNIWCFVGRWWLLVVAPV